MWKKFLIVIVMLALQAGAAEKNAIIGVLEDVTARYAGEPYKRAVRVVFEKNGSEWRAFPNDCEDVNCLKTAVSRYPEKVEWTVAFDGKSLGRLTTRAKEIQFYSNIGLQEITGAAAIPAVGERTYTTFASDTLYRPLIAVSQPNFKDPELWKPAKISPQILASMRRMFREKFPRLCRLNQDENPVPFDYLDKEIDVRKAYASQKGWILAALNLKDAVTCTPELPMVGIDCWFVADPQKKIQHLDVEGWLIDAGDYDRDGKSELIFQIDDYNRGGYVLYYDDFKKRAVFGFTYH